MEKKYGHRLRIWFELRLVYITALRTYIVYMYVHNVYCYGDVANI